MSDGTRITLLRHGTTDANTSGLFLGQTDVPLNERGRREADALGQRMAPISFDVLVSSTLQRASHTAQAVAERHPTQPTVHPEPRLKEMHLGDFEVLPAKEVHRDHPELIARWVQDPADVRMPGAGAETLGEVQARAWAAVEDLHAAHTGGHIVLVSHTFTLLTIICRVLGVPVAHFRHLHIDRASLSRIEWGRFGPTLRVFNDTAHLDTLTA